MSWIHFLTNIDIAWVQSDGTYNLVMKQIVSLTKKKSFYYNILRCVVVRKDLAVLLSLTIDKYNIAR